MTWLLDHLGALVDWLLDQFTPEDDDWPEGMA